MPDIDKNEKGNEVNEVTKRATKQLILSVVVRRFLGQLLSTVVLLAKVEYL